MHNTIDITRERFFASKSERVLEVGVEKQRALGEYTWQLVRVELEHRTELYQLLVDASGDALSTPAGATAYVVHARELGEVHGHLEAGPARPMGAEQSNTNLIVGESIVKVFRKLEDGLNPDVELISRIDNPHVAKVTGYVTDEGRTLAMQQELVRGVDGFELATAGGLEPAGASELGAAVRSVHESLAAEFGTEVLPGAQVRDRLNANLDAYLRRAEALRPYEERLRALYDSLADSEVRVQRVHGDLHLGQTLRGEDTWYLIDFEGEPARPLEQRRLPDVPARDLAGMVRSFGYARAVGGFGEEWYQGCVDKLQLGYGEVDGGLLAAYVADKAAYEVVYEANNRPGWVGIPLAAVKELCST